MSEPTRLEEARKQLGMAAAKLISTKVCPLCGVAGFDHSKWVKEINEVAVQLGGVVETDAPARKSAVACLKSASYMVHKAAIEGVGERVELMKLMKTIGTIRDRMRGH